MSIYYPSNRPRPTPARPSASTPQTQQPGHGGLTADERRRRAEQLANRRRLADQEKAVTKNFGQSLIDDVKALPGKLLGTPTPTTAPVKPPDGGLSTPAVLPQPIKGGKASPLLAPPPIPNPVVAGAPPMNFTPPPGTNPVVKGGTPGATIPKTDPYTSAVQGLQGIGNAFNWLGNSATQGVGGPPSMPPNAPPMTPPPPGIGGGSSPYTQAASLLQWLPQAATQGIGQAPLPSSMPASGALSPPLQSPSDFSQRHLAPPISPMGAESARLSGMAAQYGLAGPGPASALATGTPPTTDLANRHIAPPGVIPPFTMTPPPQFGGNPLGEGAFTPPVQPLAGPLNPMGPAAPAAPPLGRPTVPQQQQAIAQQFGTNPAEVDKVYDLQSSDSTWQQLGFNSSAEGMEWARGQQQQTGKWPWEGTGSFEDNLGTALQSYYGGAGTGAAPGAGPGGMPGITPPPTSGFSGGLGSFDGGGGFGPFPSFQAWQQAFASEHGGRPPNEVDVQDALSSFDFLNTTGESPTMKDWKRRYYTGGFFGEGDFRPTPGYGSLPPAMSAGGGVPQASGLPDWMSGSMGLPQTGYGTPGPTILPGQPPSPSAAIYNPAKSGPWPWPGYNTNPVPVRAEDGTIVQPGFYTYRPDPAYPPLNQTGGY